ncbi:MAG: VC0807 family protein [Chloroflexota bacterium]
MSQPGPPDQPMRPPGGGFSMRGMLVTLLPNVVLPWIIYQWLTSRGVSTISALMATAVVPLAVTLYSWLRDRRVDALGIMTLAFVAIGLVTSLISGDPIFYLVKESLLTGVWGLIMLGSLLASRPLTFYFGRQFMSGGDPERAAFFDRLWEVPEFRALQRKLSIIWGGGLIAEALVRVGLVYALPIPVFLIVSPAMGLGVTALLIGMSVVLGRRGQLRMRRMQQERKQATAQTQTMPA